MSQSPVICFGQQPCGFFPKRFLIAKILTARRLQKEIGGDIVFFFHDSDHDPRETQTILRHRKTNEPAILNFSFANKIQRKFSPLFLKRIPEDWPSKTTLQLPNYVDGRLIEIFKKASSDNVADFCLEMYRNLGWLDGARVLRSSDPAFRRTACDIADFFVEVPYENEIVRARYIPEPGRADLPVGQDAEQRVPTSHEGSLQLHEGGDRYLTLPPTTFAKEQISPTRDTRLRWMQSVVHCTHYVAGVGELAYLRRDDAPEITFISRDAIDSSDEAYTETAK
jgi:hypothetical protein